MDLAHRPDGPVPQPLVDQPVALEGHALVAHLRGDLVLARGLGQGAGFVEGAGQRLLAVDVLAPLDGRHGDDRVRVVGRADDDRVDALLPVEHLAEVLVLGGLGVLLERVGRVAPVHVAQGHDVLAGDLLDVPAALAADAHAGDVQLLAWWRLAGPAKHVPRNDHDRRGGPCGVKEPAAREPAR